jgi:hypothetical protein
LALRGETKGSVKPAVSGKRVKSDTPGKPLSGKVDSGVNAEKGIDKNADKGNVGKSLRTVYQETVNEEIPSELLDLLGKLT